MSLLLTVLSNGVRVVTNQTPAVETVALGAWIGVGARHEQAELNGASHLLEHMVFKGTRRRSARRIVEEIENVGGFLNAYTSHEQTAYYARALKEDAELAVDLIADIVRDPVINPDELARERSVVAQEIRHIDSSPDESIYNLFQEAAYPDQALGRPVIGNLDTVHSITREALQAHHGTHYIANTMVLAAAGAINHDDFTRMVEARFGDLRACKQPPPDGARYQGGVRRDERQDLGQVHAIFGFDGVSYADPVSYYATLTLATLLGGGMSSRLFQEVREKRGLAYAVNSFTDCYTDGGLFGVYVGTNEQTLSDVAAIICAELRKAGDGVNEDELRRARAQLKAELMMGLENPFRRCEQAARQLLYMGRLVPVEEIADRLDAVDAAATAAAARRITKAQPTVAILGTMVDTTPDHDSVRSLLLHEKAG